MIFGKKKETKPTKKTPQKASKKEVTKAPKKEAAVKTAAVPAVEKKAEPAEKKTPRIATQSDIRKHLGEGWLRVLITFELVGKPREHVEQTLKAYILNIKNDSRILAISEEFADALEHEDGMFSAFCEFETLVKDLETLTWLAINFMPANIEVLEPQSLKFDARFVNNWSNDLLAKLHEVSNILREERSVNTHLTQSLNALIQNAIIAALRESTKDVKGLQKVTGIAAKQLDPFLKHLVEKQKVKERKGVYSLE